MLTKEVNDWVQRVKKGNYSSWDIMEEFEHFSKYLTKTEMLQIHKQLQNHIKTDLNRIDV